MRCHLFTSSNLRFIQSFLDSNILHRHISLHFQMDNIQTLLKRTTFMYALFLTE